MNRQEALELFGYDRVAEPSESAVKKEYYKRVLKCHPDKFPTAEYPELTEEFRNLTEAYEIITGEAAEKDLAVIQKRLDNLETVLNDTEEDAEDKIRTTARMADTNTFLEKQSVKISSGLDRLEARLAAAPTKSFFEFFDFRRFWTSPTRPAQAPAADQQASVAGNLATINGEGSSLPRSRLSLSQTS